MSRSCIVPSCPKPHLARGFCDAHYQAWRTGRQDLQPLAKQVRQGRPCAVCGEEIPSHRTGKAMYCGPLCKRRAQAQKERIHPPARRNRPCSADGCGSSTFARGLCQKHYGRLMSKGSLDDVRKNARGGCGIDGCNSPHVARGLCQRHHNQEWAAQRRAKRIASRPHRTCLTCEQPLRREQDSRTLFCSRACKEKDRVASGRSAEASRRYHYSSQYGMSRADALDRFGGRCNICDAPEGGGRHGNLHIDHCHESGQVRGVLCHGCNVSLGHFKDNPALLRAAAEYLERSLSI